MTYMDQIRAIQAKVRAFVPLTDAETAMIKEYANAKVAEMITEHRNRNR